MKKIRLNVANLEGTEILSREQLKSIFGGSGSGSGSIPVLMGTRCYNNECYCDWDNGTCDEPCDMAICGLVGTDC